MITGMIDRIYYLRRGFSWTLNFLVESTAIDVSYTLAVECLSTKPAVTLT